MKMRPLLPEFWSLNEITLRFNVPASTLRKLVREGKLGPMDFLIIGDPMDDPKPGKLFVNYHWVEKYLGGPVTETNLAYTPTAYQQA